MNIKNDTSPVEGIDLQKLGSVVRKNIPWIILIFLVTNIAGYLTIRWTKDLFESESELKLEVKQDVSDLGLKNIAEDQNLNLIAGEIEQIKSRVFFERVIDSLDLAISYYSVGKVLNDEMYKRNPFEVKVVSASPGYYDRPIYFNFTDENSYTIRLQENGSTTSGKLNERLKLDGAEIIITKTPKFISDLSNDYFFILNSKAALQSYLSQNISVVPINFNANTIKISFRDFNAWKAHDIVNGIDSTYLVYSNEQKNLANKQKIEWLNNELGQVEKKMEDFENYFEAFTLQNKSSNVDDDLKKTIYFINRIDSQRFELNKRITALNQVLDAMSVSDYQLTFTQRQFLPDYINQKLDKLQQLIQDQSKLGLAYNENTFAFRKSENEVKSLTDLVFKQLTELKKDWMKSALELNQRKEKLEKDFATMPDKNTQFAKNQRFYKLYEEFYLSMMQSKAQFEIAQAGNTPDFKILSSATMPSQPISPKKLMIVGIGVIAGLVLNFFLIGILYIANDKIISINELEKSLSVPVLGVIPTSHSPASASPFHVTENPKSIISEAIRTLRSNLDFFTSLGNRKSIAISSTISGEGKSFLALNLGGVLAMSRKKVALLDLDMRKPKHRLPFEVKDPSKGISTILIQKNSWQDCVVKTPLENFDYIPSGPQPPNPSELLLNGEFSLLLDNLKQAYDYVVMDTPPVGLVTDGIMAMKGADLCIYVMRANYSKKEFISSLKRTIRLNKFSNIAVVLNAIPASRKAYGYGYYEDNGASKSWWKKLLKQ